MKKLFALLLIIVAIVAGALYTLPSTLKKASETVLSEVLQTPVTVDSIDFSVANSTFKVANVTIQDYPQFSNSNLFVMKDLTLAVDPKSLMTEVITINEFSIADLSLKLTGGIKNNSLKELQHVISLREQFEEQEKAKHMESTESHEGHNHQKSELKLKVKELRFDNISVAAKITEPLDLPEESIKVSNVRVKDLGGENGVNVHTLTKQITQALDMVITQEVSKILPAQKVYEDAKAALEKGVDDSKQFIEETFTKENIEKSKQKADELLNKLF